MLELLKFIFESPFHFIGCLILLSMASNFTFEIINGYQPPERDDDDFKDSDLHKEGKLKMYKCSDCQELNYLKDNGEITVGYCSHCSHPLWNSK